MVTKHLPVTMAMMLALTGTAGFLRLIGGDPQPVASELSVTDRQFVSRAAQAGEAELALAKLAQARSQNPQLKSLAAKIQHAHESVNATLRTLADKKRVKLPGPSVAQQAALDRMAVLSGAAFDQAWTTQVVKGGKEAITLFTQATRSTDLELKAFAEATLRSLRGHLQAAQGLN